MTIIVDIVVGVVVSALLLVGILYAVTAFIAKYMSAEQ